MFEHNAPSMLGDYIVRKLKGQNRIERHRGIAEDLVSKIIENNSVAGIVFAGGLARGFADEYSDVDVLAFLREKNQNSRDRILKLGVDEQKRVARAVRGPFWFAG